MKQILMLAIIRRFEEAMQRPFDWSICQLHRKKLPLHHLLITLDGKNQISLLIETANKRFTRKVQITKLHKMYNKMKLNSYINQY